MWHQVQLVPCHTTYSPQPLTIRVVLKSCHISCITLSHPHTKVHKYLFQLLHSVIVTPNVLPLFSDTRNVQPLESSFVWGEPLACGWSVLCFLPLSLLQLATDHHIQDVFPPPLPSSSPAVDDCFRLRQPRLDADSAEWRSTCLFAADCHDSLWTTFSKNVAGSVLSPTT